MLSDLQFGWLLSRFYIPRREPRNALERLWCRIKFTVEYARDMRILAKGGN